MPDGPKVFLPTERLYRVLEPGFWDSVNNLIYPPAFLDEGKGYEKVSVYLGSKASPRDALEVFSRFSGIRRTYNDPTPEDLWGHGYGIGVLTYAQVLRLGLDLEKKPGGAINYNARGHTNIPGGQMRAAGLASLAVALRHEEIFGS